LLGPTIPPALHLSADQIIGCLPATSRSSIGHRAHGTLTVDTGSLTANGYRLEVACLCGVTFERWITPREAAADLAILVRLN
jgi:hypothetical protein